ncbi:MAG: methyltransferase domain-containing protein [Pseudomonadota bacterium]
MSRVFWNLIANRYAKQPVAAPDTYQAKLDLTRQYLQPDMRVLEVGCGTGSTALVHAEYVEHILATDYSQKMIDIARQKAQAAAVTNVEFQVAALDGRLNGTQGQLQGAADFDAVLALNILHLVPDLGEALKQINARLRAGGLLISSTPCLQDRAKFVPLLKLAGSLRLIPRVNILTPEQLFNAIQTAGFVSEQAATFNHDMVHFSVMRKST